MQTPSAPGAEAAELARRNRELSLVHDLALAINSNLELSHILGTVADRLRDLVAFDDIEVVLPSGYRQGDVKASWPRAPRSGESALLDTGRHGRACVQCEVLLRGEARWEISATSACPSLEATHFKSSVCVPLTIGGKGRGLLWLRAFEPEVYDEDDMRLLEMVAAHLAVAVANAEALSASRELARARGDFFALASHQLRTPLTVARGYTDILAGGWESLPPDERDLYLQRVSRCYGQLADLVDEMLDIARIEGGVAALRIEPVDLQEILEDWCEMAGERLGDRPLELDRNACLVSGDRFRLAQVVSNLLENAIKYSAGPGPVRVTWTESTSGYARTEVSNPVPDLTAQELGELFQPFHRLGRHAHLPGTGLGLRACKSLVELLGGAIGVKSGGGRFTVWFELPVALASVPSSQ